MTHVSSIVMANSKFRHLSLTLFFAIRFNFTPILDYFESDSMIRVATPSRLYSTLTLHGQCTQIIVCAEATSMAALFKGESRATFS